MKNSIKSQFKNICALAILIFTISTTKVEAQANCCNNDTIYFDNQVDCPICITVECYDPNSGSTNPFSPFSIQNNLPTVANPILCPDPGCAGGNYISCGGPASPQFGKIILSPNACELCPSLKFSLLQIGTNIISPPLTIYSSTGINSNILLNSPCCSSSSTPNLEMTFDCNTKTLYLKCTQ